MMEERILNRLRAEAGLDAVGDSLPELLAYSVDCWPRQFVTRMYGGLPDERPAAVVRPRDVDSLCRVVAVCREEGVPVVPWGAGSGVCGGANAVRGCVVVDLKRMNRLESVDPVSMTAWVEAGMNGMHLEEALNERGCTLGHFPSSILCSTVGGWVATRSAGQFSSRYGKIEDLVLGLEVVLPDGSLVPIDAMAPHGGAPDFCQLLVGSEGTLGVVARVLLKLSPLPTHRDFCGFRFMDVPSGLMAMRSIQQEGLRPMVMRLYDPLDTFINSFSALMKHRDGEAGAKEGLVDRVVARTLGELRELSSGLSGTFVRGFFSNPGPVQHLMDRMPLGCLLVVGFEGEASRTRDDIQAARQLAIRATGRDLGQEPGEHWYRKRYDVSFKMSKVFNSGAFVDTIEVAGLWRDVHRVYSDVRRTLMNRVAVMAHFSHAYREGCAVYFTLAGAAGDREKALRLYDWAIRMALGRAMAAGATVSHHHGIGVMKRSFTPEEYRGGQRLFGLLKEAMDPSLGMNPGKVYPPSVQPTVGDEPSIRDDEHFSALLGSRPGIGSAEPVVPDVPEEIPEMIRLARVTGRRFRCQDAAFPARKARRENGASLFDLSRLSEVLEMDIISNTVTVQAGLSVQQLENFLREKGFSLGYVPRFRRGLTIGDYLANAVPGEGSPLYGTVRENCIGLSAVLSDGTTFSVRPVPRRAAGPDLAHCLIGSQGRYGIITAACFRVFPVPAVREALAFAADDPVIAVSAVRSILHRCARPEWALVAVRAPVGLGNRRRVRLVLQLGGSRESVSADMKIVREVTEPLGMDAEAVRAEDRMVGPASRPSPMESCWVPMDELMPLVAACADGDVPGCPEILVTDILTHGAMLRSVLHDDGHAHPRALMERIEGAMLPAPLAAISDRLARLLDPEGVLNPGEG